MPLIELLFFWQRVSAADSSLTSRNNYVRFYTAVHLNYFIAVVLCVVIGRQLTNMSKLKISTPFARLNFNHSTAIRKHMMLSGYRILNSYGVERLRFPLSAHSLLSVALLWTIIVSATKKYQHKNKFHSMCSID